MLAIVTVHVAVAGSSNPTVSTSLIAGGTTSPISAQWCVPLCPCATAVTGITGTDATAVSAPGEGRGISASCKDKFNH